MSGDFNPLDLIEEMQAPKRKTLDEDQISERLDYYSNRDGGFEVTDEYGDAFRSIFRDVRNVFLTGGAGVGKTSFVQSILIPELDHRGLRYAVCATTGIAGSHIGGRTIHSWAGVRTGPQWREDEPCPQDMHPRKRLDRYADFFDELAGKAPEPVWNGLKKRIKSTEVVILDEVSMCGGASLLGYIDYHLRRIREDFEKPFGGIQMIFVGDFAQLPPVERRQSVHHPDWAFLSRSWSGAEVKTHEFTKVFRQKDRDFSDFLNKIRLGEPADRDYLAQFVKPVKPEESGKYSYLVPTNEMADAINAKALERYSKPDIILEGKFEIHQSQLRRYDTLPKVREQLLRGRPVKQTLFLRPGMPVLITRNAPDGTYVNGSRAFVEKLIRGGTHPLHEEDTLVLRVPEEMRIDGGKGDLVLNMTRFAHMRSAHEDYDEKMFDQESGATICRHPALLQFPVIPGAAITIHKSQGMSLDSAVVHLGKAFAAGHVYVGLSRLRSPEGLRLTTTEFEVKVDPWAKAFYQDIRNESGQ